jgi:hypothetical protein
MMEQATPTRKFTSKQMGGACEMLVAAELTLAGVPALKVPENWPHYDVIAQPVGLPPQRVSVKSRTWKRGAAYLEQNCHDEFDWLCAVTQHQIEGTSGEESHGLQLQTLLTIHRLIERTKADFRR